MIACSFTGAVIRYLGLTNTNHHFTYPSSANQSVNSSNYCGPVDTTMIPVEFVLNQNATIDLPVVHINLSVDEIIDATAMANLSYGGGLFFKSNNHSNIPIIAPAVLGAGTNLASTFFAKKAMRLRDERILEAQQNGYIKP